MKLDDMDYEGDGRRLLPIYKRILESWEATLGKLSFKCTMAIWGEGSAIGAINQM